MNGQDRRVPCPHEAARMKRSTGQEKCEGEGIPGNHGSRRDRNLSSCSGVRSLGSFLAEVTELRPHRFTGVSLAEKAESIWCTCQDLLVEGTWHLHGFRTVVGLQSSITYCVTLNTLFYFPEPHVSLCVK